MRLVRLLAAFLVGLQPGLLCAQVPTKDDWKQAVEAAAGASAKAAAPAAPAGQAELAQLPPPAPGGGLGSPAPGSPAAPPAGPLPAGMPPLMAGMNAAEHQELDKLTAENQAAVAEVDKRLKPLIQEREELHIKSDLDLERLRAELAKLDADYQRLMYANRLAEEKDKQELEALGAQQKRLAAENALADETHKKELSDLRQDKDKLSLANDKLHEELRTAELKNQTEKEGLDLESQRMSVEETRLKLEHDRLDDASAKLQIQLDERAKRRQLKQATDNEPLVLKEPFKDGVLTVSDRRIALDGVIVKGVSDYVADRIHYYNNVSDDPIFVVIDRCPGGSVMEGYRIVKAIQSSRAPVHVVVKSFAASMCAVITTLAPHSYVYPNAIILHHQMSTVLWGNMTQTKEQLEIAREWWRRLSGPVAKKMGTSLDGLVKLMYEKNSDGDWQEFGDKAVDYKWADDVVEEVRETGVIDRPDDEKHPNPGLVAWASAEKTDEKGAPYVTLPRLDPFDFYWIYNPDHYYR